MTGADFWNLLSSAYRELGVLAAAGFAVGVLLMWPSDPKVRTPEPQLPSEPVTTFNPTLRPPPPEQSTTVEGCKTLLMPWECGDAEALLAVGIGGFGGLAIGAAIAGVLVTLFPGLAGALGPRDE